MQPASRHVARFNVRRPKNGRKARRVATFTDNANDVNGLAKESAEFAGKTADKQAHDPRAEWLGATSASGLVRWRVLVGQRPNGVDAMAPLHPLKAQECRDPAFGWAPVAGTGSGRSHPPVAEAAI